MDFETMMAQISNTLNNKFTKILENATKDKVITISEFKGYYLASFLVSHTNYLQPSLWHEIIDSISLCTPEIEFFHAFANLNEDVTGNSFIESALELYKHTEDLSECQLGNSIKLRLTNKYFWKIQIM